MKFLLIGDGRYSNRGCEAIVRGTVEILSRKYSDAEYLLSPFGKNLEDDARSENDKRIMHRIPNPPLKKYSLPWMKYRLPRKFFPSNYDNYLFGVQMKALQDSVCSLMLGGDNYSMDYGIPHEFIRFNELLIAENKPQILWGGSIGPFSSNADVEKIMSSQLQSFSLITARETETISYLESINVVDNVKLVADPAFVMQPTEPDLPTEVLEFIERGAIGLNLNPMVGRYKENSDDGKWLGEASNIIESIVKSKMAPLLLVPHVTDKTQNDYEFMKAAVESGIGWSDAVMILPENLRASEYKYVISKLRAFAGARTHTTIASLSSCIPTISIGYSMKARGINKDIFGHLNWVLPIDVIKPDNMVDKFDELLSKHSEVKKHLQEVIPSFKERAYKAADYLDKVI